MARARDAEMGEEFDSGALKAKILAALDKGDYKVEYGLPGNVSLKKRADGTEYYVIDLSDDEDICEKLRFLDDVYVSDCGDEDAIRQICICHSGRDGSEVEIYLSDGEDLPDEEEDGTEASGVQAVGGIGAGKREIGDDEYERDAALEGGGGLSSRRQKTWCRAR